MVPLEFDNPVRFKPWGTFFLFFVNVIAFAAMVRNGVRFEYGHIDFSGYSFLIREFGLVPASFQLKSVFTSMFVHGGPLHLLGNMICLIMFGDNVEDAIGWMGIILTYLVLGVVSALTFAFANMGLDVPLVGASGAIAGIIGIYWVLFPRAKFRIYYYAYLWFPASARIACLLWLLEQVFLNLLAEAQTHGSSVAYLAHIAGVAAGFGLGLLLKKSGVLSRYVNLKPRSAAFGYL